MIRRYIPMWAIPTLVILAVLTVWVRLSIVRSSYEIDQNDKAIHNLKQEREQLQLQAAALRSPRRLEALAKTRFGLQQPRSDQVIRFGSEVNAP
jgi:cell division protein FtsL